MCFETLIYESSRLTLTPGRGSDCPLKNLELIAMKFESVSEEWNHEPRRNIPSSYVCPSCQQAANSLHSSGLTFYYKDWLTSGRIQD